MYQALEIRRLIGALSGLGGLILVLLVCYALPDSPLGWVKYLSYAVSGTGLIVAAVGNKWVFGWFWQWKPVQSFMFPYIAGEWTGTISSNWPTVKTMMDAFVEGSAPHPMNDLHITEQGFEEIRVKATIEADFFRVSMKLITVDQYSTSHSIVVRPQRHSSIGNGPVLFYVYENDTDVPEKTDTGFHFGAAYLDVAKDGSTLRGSYWTERNWVKGLNTAGHIKLRREPPRHRRA